MTDNRPRGAMCWYERSSYDRLAAADADLPRSFDEAIASAERRAQELEQQGFIIERIVIDADEFLAWSRDAGRDPDNRARAQFALMVAARKRGH